MAIWNFWLRRVPNTSEQHHLLGNRGATESSSQSAHLPYHGADTDLHGDPDFRRPVNSKALEVGANDVTSKGTCVF